MTHKKKKLTLANADRSENRRADFDDAVTVRSRDMAPRTDDGDDSRMMLLFALDSFSFDNDNDDDGEEE